MEMLNQQLDSSPHLYRNSLITLAKQIQRLYSNPSGELSRIGSSLSALHRNLSAFLHSSTRLPRVDLAEIYASEDIRDHYRM